MARWQDLMPLHEEYEQQAASDEEGTMGGAPATHHRAKPRRKSHQRPQGSDQIRQAFSKRKKGLVLKAFQLNALTDAKVFMFIVNDKGTSWAYATPGYADSLNHDILKDLRTLANVPDSAKLITEVMPDPVPARPMSTTASDQTHTQNADPVFDNVPPSTRAAAGPLPTRSHSWGSDGYVGQPGDRLPPSASNRHMQSGEHTPMMHNTGSGAGVRGSSMAYGNALQQQQTGLHGKGPSAAAAYGMHYVLGQQPSLQDSPTLVTDTGLPGSGSPSSKLRMPGSSSDAAAQGDGAGGMDWAAQEALPGWDVARLAQQQQYTEEQYQEAQLLLQQHLLQMGQQQAGFYTAGGPGMAGLEGDFGPPCFSSAPAAATSQPQAWALPPFVAGSMLAGYAGAADEGEAFESLQQGLAPLRMGPQASSNAIWRAGSPGDSAGPGSAPAAAQWVHCTSGTTAGADSASCVPCSKAGGPGCRTDGSATRPSASPSPSPVHCSLGGSSSAAGGAEAAAAAPNAAQALMMARGSSPPDAAAGSPTAGLSQRMRTLLAVQVPTLASGEQAAGGQRQGGQLSATDDVSGDPIMQMLLDQPLAELTPTTASQQQPGAMAPSGEPQRRLSITQAELQHAGAGGGGGSSPPQLPPASSPAGSPTDLPAAAGDAMPPQLSALYSIAEMLKLIPMPPKTDAEKDMWQQQVRGVLQRLHPVRRLELAKLSEQQWLLAQAKNDSGSSVRPHSSKQRPGPSRLSCSSPAVDPTAPPAPRLHPQLPAGGPAALPVSMAPPATGMLQLLSGDSPLPTGRPAAQRAGNGRPGAALQEALGGRGMPACSSPLKRSQPGSCTSLASCEDGAPSPMKRSKPPAAQQFAP